jgi:hypothetical protein
MIAYLIATVNAQIDKIKGKVCPIIPLKQEERRIKYDRKNYA